MAMWSLSQECKTALAYNGANRCNSPYQQTSYKIISLNAKIAFDKIQYLLPIKRKKS